MGLSIASLNSGSNGNCYYIGNEHDAVLVDAGISCRETERRMKRLELDIHKVRAIFVTHEHADHINGIRVLVKKYRLPVYITPQTKDNGRVYLPYHLCMPFKAYEPVRIGGLEVVAIPKAHDAIDPHSFLVSDATTTVGVFTDVGYVCDHMINSFRQCNAAFLETNYDVDMLENGYYTMALKNRIRGGKGHLSNAQALQLFCEHRPEHMTHVLLSHLSQDNNRPELVKEIFDAVAGHVNVIIASRHEESSVFSIVGSTDAMRTPLQRPAFVRPFMLRKPKRAVIADKFQLSLF